MYTNSTDSSFGEKTVDQLLDEYEFQNGMHSILVKQYEIKDSDEERYIAEFEYKDIHYQIKGTIEKEEFDIDLLLLDINMPEYDGLNTAKYIRENNVDVDIIFITVSAEHIFDGYTYKAFSYILKPVDKKRLDDEIGRYMTERSKCTNLTD